MKNNEKNSLSSVTLPHIALLPNDLAKLNGIEEDKIETNNELKALYDKEFQFYDFYFLAVADRS